MRITKGILVLLAIGGIIITQYYFDLNRFWPTDTLRPVLPARVIEIAGLGLDTAIASFLWINVIQHIGDQQWLYASEEIRLINQLDKNFVSPYTFAALILPGIHQITEGIEIAQNGIANVEPPNWKIPYYLALTYHTHLGDKVNAFKYFSIAANTPDSPERIKTLVARYGNNPTFRENMREIWLSVYEIADDDITKQHALNLLERLRVLDILEEGARRFYERFGRYPKVPEDLIEAGIMNRIPSDPFGSKIIFIEDGTAFVVK